MPTFFFSSRRRHTSSTRDWSSDVCSSDLDGFSTAGTGFGYSYPSPRDPWMRIDRIMADKKHFRFRSFEVINNYISDHFAVRSEERRVGKECRSGGARYL